MKENEAGAIVVRSDDGKPRVLVITAKKNVNHWLFPKGHIDPGERAADAAKREAMEEAGVEAIVTHTLGDMHYDLDDRRIHVQYFLLDFLSETEADEKRKKAWLSVDEAERRLTFDSLRDILRNARPLIASQRA